MTYFEAIKKAVSEKLRSQESLYVFGQDICSWGGYGEVFKGLPEKFPSNFFDTPIAEAATTGIATGMAIMGKPTLVEYAFFDFILHATDQIINNASKISFFSGKKVLVPLTLYVTLNSNRQYGATHSQSLEFVFSNIPGLEVVFPSNATDAYEMFRQRLSSNAPGLFVTHKLLLESEFEPNPVKEGRARVTKKGNDLTIFSYGRSIEIVRHLISELDPKKDAPMRGIELIDLRYLTNIDYDTLIKSVLKTKRVLAIEEGYGAISKKVLGELATRTNRNQIEFHSLTSSFESIGPSNEKNVLIDKYKIFDKIKTILE